MRTRNLLGAPILALLLMTPGCVSISYRIKDGADIYPGVRAYDDMFSAESRNKLATQLGGWRWVAYTWTLLDFPLTLALDTALLPVDAVICLLSSDDEPTRPTADK